MDTSSLYNICLRKIASYLSEGVFDALEINNPFKCFPSAIIRDLMSAMMHFQQTNGFKADNREVVASEETLPELKIQGLELLLTSGRLPELKIQEMNVESNLGRVLELLASSCQNLEFLTLTFNPEYGHDVPEALEKLLRNAHNLKKIECETEFDLKALQNCKNIQSIKLMYTPTQPWCNFLQDENGCFQFLHSLKEFWVKHIMGLLNGEVADNVMTILRYCPGLLSLGSIDTTRTFALLHQTRTVPFVKFRHCFWSDYEEPSKRLHPEMVRDAVMYHRDVEKLDIVIESSESIVYLRNLRNLVYLNISSYVNSDISVQINMVLKDIGYKLKFLKLWIIEATDIGEMVKDCNNLEALSFSAFECPNNFKTDIILPKLQYFSLDIEEKESQVLPLFTGCKNLTELFLSWKGAMDDENLRIFLKRNNSFTKLKIAYSHYFGLTEHGFKKFLLNAPNLQHIVTLDLGEKMLINSALRELNHAAKTDATDIWIDECFQKRYMKYRNYYY